MTEAREKARELTRDERDVLMHAARRHLRVSGVPLNAEQVATLIELGYACIPRDSRHENDWFFTDAGVAAAVACGFLPGPQAQAKAGAKFTPGPWGYDPCVSMHDRPDLPCIVDRDRLVVAQCWDDGHSEAECEANARLIAAAPDLANSIRPVVAAWEATLAAAPDEIEIDDDDTFVIRLTAAEWQAIRAALSKAEGASQ